MAKKEVVEKFKEKKVKEKKVKTKIEQLVVGIDIGSYAVKVCVLQQKPGNYKLVALGSANLPPAAVEDGILLESATVSKVISTLLKNLKIGSKSKVGISISGYSVIVKKIHLDNMEKDDLEQYIRDEAEQYIPFDIKDVYIDFQKFILPDSPSRCDVMLVAAKKDVINDYIDMLDDLKMQVVLVDVDGFALENIWKIAFPDIDTVALVDIGASKMNINIVSDGISVLARDIVVGSEQLTDQISHSLDIDYFDAEKIKLGIVAPEEGSRKKIEEIFMRTCTQWVLEVKKAIDLYLANNPDKPLSVLVLSGGGAKVDGLAGYISEETGMEVIVFNPFKDMIIDEKKIDRQYLNAIAPEMAIAAGLAIRPVTF